MSLRPYRPPMRSLYTYMAGGVCLLLLSILPFTLPRAAEPDGPPWCFEGPTPPSAGAGAGAVAAAVILGAAACPAGAGAGAGERQPALPPEEAARHLGRPLPAIYQGLYADGRVLPVEVTVAMSHKGKLLLGGRPPCAPDGGAADGGRADGPDGGAAIDGGAADAGPARCPAPGRPPLALLPLLRDGVPAPVVLDPRVLPGTVRRMIGRKSLAARGRFVGEGVSVAAAFKLRAAAVQLAVFGESGGLRLHQSVRWRSGRSLSARPAALFAIPGLGGPGRDGLLLIGESDEGAVPLVLHFDGRSLRTYP